MPPSKCWPTAPSAISPCAIAMMLALRLRCWRICRSARGDPGFRLLKRAIERAGREGPAELGKVEALLAVLDRAIANGERQARLKQTLAGAAISLIGGRIHVDPAPPRRAIGRERRPHTAISAYIDARALTTRKTLGFRVIF